MRFQQAPLTSTQATASLCRPHHHQAQNQQQEPPLAHRRARDSTCLVFPLVSPGKRVGWVEKVGAALAEYCAPKGEGTLEIVRAVRFALLFKTVG